jgi:hypothetical protein
MATMSWKRAIFLGGTVLLLAACDSATAPTAQTTELGASHRSDARAKRSSATTTTSLPTSSPALICHSGYSVQIGFVDTTSVAGCVR